jgi:integrase
MAGTVSLYKEITTDGKRRFIPINLGRGRQPEQAGAFYIRYFCPTKNKRTWENVGQDFALAKTARAEKEQLLKLGINARAAGIALPLEGKSDEPVTLQQAIEKYLDHIRERVTGLELRPLTLVGATHILNEFKQFSKKHYLKDITLKILKEYSWWSREQSPSKSIRTASNKFIRVNSMLKFNGHCIAKNKDGPKDDRDLLVETFTEEELAKFFAVCDPYQSLIFETFLKSGLRERELTTLRWVDCRLEDGYVIVQPRPEYEFVPKSGKNRNVYLPNDLIEKLKAHRNSQEPKSRLVFPTAGGNVNNKLLRTCKRLAAKAGLNPESWWLHKFRAHHATHCLRSGMDIETLKRHLGHSKDSKSIWSYLLAVQGRERHQQISQIWAPIPVPAQAVATGVSR